MHFGFLQANHVWLVLLNDGGKLMRTGAQPIDIKRNKFHCADQMSKETGFGW